MIDKIIRYLYYTLFLFTPLIMYAYTSEIFEFNKMLFIYTVTSMILACWIAKMIVSKKIIFKKTPLDFPLLLFLCIIITSTFFSIDFHTSLWGYYGRFNGGLISLFCYSILYFAFVNNFEKQYLSNLLKSSIVSSIIVMLWGLPGRFGHDLSCLLFTGQFSNACWTDQFRPAERMFSTLGQPNWLGAYLAIQFFIGLYFLLKINAKTLIYQKIFFYFYSVTVFISILFTRSRSALAAVGIGFLFLSIYILYHQYKDSSQKTNFYRILIITLIILIVFLKTGIPSIDKYLQLPQSQPTEKVHQPTNVASIPLSPQTDVTESLDIRKIVWQGAVDLGKKHPYFGTGPETFAYAYYFVRPQAHNLTSEWDYLYNKAHNEYLNYLATTGFLGLGSYLLMISFVLILFIIHAQPFSTQIKVIAENKSNNNAAIEQSNNRFLFFCLLLGYISILITNFFGFSITTINLFFYVLPGCIFLSAVNHDNKDTKNSLTLLQKLGLLGVIGYSLYTFLYLINYWQADISYKRGDDASKTGEYVNAMNYLSRAMTLRQDHVYDDKLSYIMANLAYLAATQKETETVNQLIGWAKKYNERSIIQSPKNVLYWKTKAKNDYLFYQVNPDTKILNDGISALQTAEKLSPTDPKLPYTEAIYYSLYADNDTSKNYQDLMFKAIDVSIKLKPNYRDAYFLKAQLLKKYGLKAQAKDVFQIIIDKINPGDLEAKKELENL